MISKLPQYTFQDGLITANVGKCSSENMTSYDKNDQWKDYSICLNEEQDALMKLLNEYKRNMETCSRDLSTKEIKLSTCLTDCLTSISLAEGQQANSESTVVWSGNSSRLPKPVIVGMVGCFAFCLASAVFILIAMHKQQRQQNMLFEQQLRRFKQLEEVLFKN